MTIKQLNEAIMPHPDSPYQVDGHDLTQVILSIHQRRLIMEGLFGCLRSYSERAIQR